VKVTEAMIVVFLALGQQMTTIVLAMEIATIRVGATAITVSRGGVASANAQRIVGSARKYI
jgi:hypothetical protein